MNSKVSASWNCRPGVYLAAMQKERQKRGSDGSDGHAEDPAEGYDADEYGPSDGKNNGGS